MMTKLLIPSPLIGYLSSYKKSNLSFILMMGLFSCQTDQVEEPIASTRNSATDGAFEWRHIDNNTYKVLIQSMSENWSPEYISKIYPNLGDIIFRNALIELQGQDAHPELISVPIKSEDNVTGIIFCNPNGIPSVQIGAEFIHEFLHSYLVYLWHKENGNNVPSDFYIQNAAGRRVLNPNYYIKLVESFSNGDVITGDQHVLFYTHLRELILNSLHQWNGGEGEPEDYEYYFHVLINTSNLANTHLIFAQATGFIDDGGNNTFDLSSYLENWQNTGGNADGTHTLFNANCN